MKILFILFILFSSANAQLLNISGKVVDSDTGEELLFTNIRVSGSSAGTSANREGEYELKLPPGTYKLIASYIGYVSDTISIELKKHTSGIDFKLRQTNVTLPEITISPGENPALEIIRKAIERKKQRDNFLSSFEFEAYTKGTIRTEEEISAESRSVSLGIGTSEGKELKITGIIENQSRGYSKKPGLYKEVIAARKQSANFPSSVNVLTGGRLIQNFYEDDISFMGFNIPGPLSADALEFYYFQIEQVQLIDDQPVYRISMIPSGTTDPGFIGNIFIKDSTYDLIKIDLRLNRAANRGGIFDTINVFQQFGEFDSSIYMPVDYRLYAVANVLNLARFGFELSTILYDYKINPPISDSFFDMAVITVVPDADAKDSLYWSAIQSIPNTTEEQNAYRRIDSIKSMPVSFWDSYSILSPRISLSDRVMISSPIAMYHFNRVEGNTLDFGIFTEDLLNHRFNSSLGMSYGFSDKRFKTDFSTSYRAGVYRTSIIKVNAYNKLKILYADSDGYNELTATLLALLSKYEFRDYYYSKGFDITASSEVTPVIELSAGFSHHADQSAFNNSDFSFFARERSYTVNPPVNDVKVNALTAGFTLDFRKYIEDGLYRRRINRGKSFVIFSGNVAYSNEDWLKSTLGYTKYDLSVRGTINGFRSTQILFRLFGVYTEGSLPYQNLYSIPGNINLIARDFTFRTLNVNEIIGEKAATLNIEYYLRDELFRMLNVPLLNKSEIQLKTFLNIAAAVTDNETRKILPAEVTDLKEPFYEAGFGLGHILLPLQLEFAWKLNYRGINNFRIGINSFVF